MYSSFKCLKFFEYFIYSDILNHHILNENLYKYFDINENLYKYSDVNGNLYEYSDINENLYNILINENNYKYSNINDEQVLKPRFQCQAYRESGVSILAGVDDIQVSYFLLYSYSFLSILFYSILFFHILKYNVYNVYILSAR